MDTSMPLTLKEAIATEPMGLQIWIMMLVISHMGAILFVLTKQSGSLRVRPEPFLIIASFVLAAMLMSWMYEQVGYVRLLGLAHLIVWTPVFSWLAYKFYKKAFAGPFKYYLYFYFLIAGASLIIDLIDVVRYLVGDTTPLHL